MLETLRHILEAIGFAMKNLKIGECADRARQRGQADLKIKPTKVRRAVGRRKLEMCNAKMAHLFDASSSSFMALANPDISSSPTHQEAP